MKMKDDALSDKLTGVDVSVKETGPPSELSQVPPYEGEGALPAPPVLTPQEEARLWRKIDLRIMPILTLMYLFSFVDRGNIGTSSLGPGPVRILLTFLHRIRKREASGTRHTARPYRFQVQCRPGEAHVSQSQWCAKAKISAVVFLPSTCSRGRPLRLAGAVINQGVTSRTMSVPSPQSMASLGDRRTHLLTYHCNQASFSRSFVPRESFPPSQ